jgi:hypothetical protein
MGSSERFVHHAARRERPIPGPGRVRHPMRLTLVLVCLALIAGCSTLPTAPRKAAGTETIKHADATVSGALIPEGDDGDDAPGHPTGPPALPPVSPVEDGSIDTIAAAVASQVSPVFGEDGATLKAGPFQLRIPKGAFHGKAQVSLIVRDSIGMRVTLRIKGVPNKFDIPVTLSADLSHFPNPQGMGVLWLDEQSGIWVEIPSTVDAAHRVIRAPLGHFSEYSVQEIFRAKAGW